MSILAYIFAVLKNVVYGSTIFFTGSLTQNVDVLDVLALRFLMSFVVLWLLKTVRILKIKVSVKDFFVKNNRSAMIRPLLLTALFEPVLYMLFETLGITLSSGVTTGVVLSLSAITGCICEEIILKEKSTVLQKIFLGIGIFGAIYIAVCSVSNQESQDSIAGIIFLLLAVLSGSLYCVFSRRSSAAFNSMEITYVSAMLGAIVFNGINVIRHLILGDITHYFDPYFNVSNLIGFAVLAILSTIVATCMQNYACSKLKVSTIAAFGGVSTLVTVLIGVFIGGEKLHLFHMIGFSCLLIRMVGVSVISIRQDRMKTASPPSHAELNTKNFDKS